MSDTKISEAAVEAAIKAYENAIVSPAMVTNSDFMRAAIAAALPHLHPQPAELAEQQGDARAQFEAWALKRGLSLVRDQHYSGRQYYAYNDVELAFEAYQTALAATGKQQVGEVHPDDAAVDAFADAMKAKMADARAKGRGGWEDPAQCSSEDLSRMLRDHVEKGDPRDVANFCMMLHQRGEAIAAQVGEVQGDARAQFEAWSKSAGLETKIYAHNDMYSHPVTRGAWMAWQHLAACQPGAVE